MAIKVLRQSYQIWWRLAALRKRRELWLLAAAAVFLSLSLWGLAEPLERMLLEAGELRVWIRSFGPLAPLVYIATFSLQILLAPLPGQFLGVMGGYLFGVLLGSLYSIIGLMMGAGLAMVLGRRLGRPLLERFFQPSQIALWEKKLRMRSSFTWWLLFLFPVPDLIFYVAGLSSVPLRWLLLVVVTGRGLGLFIANVLGHWTAHLAPEWVLVKWTAIGVLGAFVYLYQRPLRYFALVYGRRLRRWSRRFIRA